MNRTRATTVVIVAGAWFTMLGGAAGAAVALQGSDESYGTDGGSRVAVCDHEADGRGVHADSYNLSGTYYRVDDQDGSGGSCFKTASMGTVQRHRTVEEINNWPDAAGDWSYHY